MYKGKSLKKYLDDLAAKLPAPGGGSAAALVASTGVALIGMVINFTLGKPKYAKYQTSLSETIAKSENIRERLLELVDLDVAAFKSKDTSKSLNVPLEVIRLCFNAMKLCTPLVKKGNKNLISDVAVAAILIEAGFSSALFNVEINLRYIKDKKNVKKIIDELSKKGEFIRNVRNKLEVEVDEIIRG